MAHRPWIALVFTIRGDGRAFYHSTGAGFAVFGKLVWRKHEHFVGQLLGYDERGDAGDGGDFDTARGFVVWHADGADASYFHALPRRAARGCRATPPRPPRAPGPAGIIDDGGRGAGDHRHRGGAADLHHSGHVWVSTGPTLVGGQGRFARQRFRYTGSVTSGSTTTCSPPPSRKGTPAVTEEVIVEPAQPERRFTMTFRPAGRFFAIARGKWRWSSPPRTPRPRPKSSRRRSRAGPHRQHRGPDERRLRGATHQPALRLHHRPEWQRQRVQQSSGRSDRSQRQPRLFATCTVFRPACSFRLRPIWPTSRSRTSAA